jgi:nucleoside-diphosphate-sugar epimerase
MRVLVTGNRGLIGGAVVTRLAAEGDTVVGFDSVDGHDILDAPAVAAAALGCDAIVNAAAGGRRGGNDPGSDFITYNVTGTWNVLAAARNAGIRRVVTFSSVNALGIFSGNGVPDYLPIDDAHPPRPTTAYGMAKRLCEELCRCFSLSTGITTICLRPPAVLGPARRAKFEALRAANESAEWDPFWEYGAFLDVRDVAGAVFCGLRCPDPGHVVALICADDVTSPVPVRELAARLMPQVPLREAPGAGPWDSLVRCDVARDVLGWAPVYRWRDAAA